ncbi:MAG TPA: hypothetical protein VHU81_06935 [Thermoanaerobaculia bacterium]|nr:hypothetical protein [Thermoanaerobaculia bacterium]
MSDIHITRVVLRAVHRGDLPLNVLLEIGWRHLLELCPTCDQEYRAWRQERRAIRAPHLPPKALDRLRREEKRARRKAEAEAADLLALPYPQRIEKLERSHRRFRECPLVARLLEESRGRMAADLDAAEELVDTARAVLLQARDSSDLPGLSALAMIYRANIARLRGQPDEARERFEKARTILRAQGVTDLLMFGEADAFEALLALDLGDLVAARELLRRSVALFLLGAERERASGPLRTLGHLYQLCGQPERAAEVTRAAEQIAAAG